MANCPTCGRTVADFFDHVDRDGLDCEVVEYEYAGFRYQVTLDADHRVGISAVPVPGQHRAAHKDKHRRAALSLFNEEWNK